MKLSQQRGWRDTLPRNDDLRMEIRGTDDEVLDGRERMEVGAVAE
jgi:hypothetical protein